MEESRGAEGGGEGRKETGCIGAGIESIPDWGDGRKDPVFPPPYPLTPIYCEPGGKQISTTELSVSTYCIYNM